MLSGLSLFGMVCCGFVDICLIWGINYSNTVIASCFHIKCVLCCKFDANSI